MHCLKLVLLSLLACSATGCIVIASEGSGVEVTDEREAGAFSEIEINGAFDKIDIIVCGCKNRVAVTGDDNLVDEVKTSVAGGRLKLKTSGAAFIRNRDLTVQIKVEKLDAVKVSGSANVEVHRLDNERFDLDLSGSGDIYLDGVTEKLDLKLSGSGDVRAFELLAREAEVDASGSANVDVCVTDYLSVEISGSGDVVYDCDPNSVDVESSGSSDVGAR